MKALNDDNLKSSHWAWDPFPPLKFTLELS